MGQETVLRVVQSEEKRLNTYILLDSTILPNSRKRTTDSGKLDCSLLVREAVAHDCSAVSIAGHMRLDSTMIASFLPVEVGGLYIPLVEQASMILVISA